jgi:cytosine/adenosine deaminase-related metal-dependent hydrolase
MDRNLEEAVTLAGARVALSGSESMRQDIIISGGHVRFSAPNMSQRILDMRGFLVLPGLINAHDHLEFNLFPRLGHGHYDNATAWAEDIYRPESAPLRRHLQVPKPARLLWGGIKNLLAGVTSVSHHNPYEPSVFEDRFPVRVVKRFGWAHSLRFSSDVRERFEQTPQGAPFIIHAGEGSDVQARGEVYSLDEVKVLGPSTVIVHGVAIEREDICLLKTRGASVVWCPSSNYFTLGRTLSSEVIRAGIPVALGNDSALTADGDFLDELAVARRHAGLCEIYEMATEKAARILRLNSGEGRIQDGGVADLVIVRDEGQTPAEALLVLRPELVLLNGEIKLLSASMAARLNFRGIARFEAIEVEGRGRSYIDFPVTALKQQTTKYLGKRFLLAGRRVSV